MSWFNDSLNSIKGQITSLANEVLAEGIGAESEPSKSRVEELESLVTSKESQIQNLLQENEELRGRLQGRTQLVNKEHEAENEDGWSWDLPLPTNTSEEIVSELKKTIKKLEDEKQELVSGLEQLDIDCQQTTDKLVTIKDDLQMQHNKLLCDYEDMKKKNDFLLKINDENQKKIASLENDNAKIKEASSTASDIHHKEIMKLQKKIEDFTMENKRQHDSDAFQETNNKQFKSNQDWDAEKQVLIDDKNNLHKKYIEILQSSIKNCVDCEIPQTAQNSPQLSDYTNLVEVVIKIILELKSKCETLDSLIKTLTEEKTNILNEKNYEIQRLIHNSQELSNEIILKSEDIKHYEEECAELIKNNELLLTRLDEMKNASSLQTISETNEDSVLQLEVQLDSANKRIEELEGKITDTPKHEYEQSELKVVKEKLEITDVELINTKKEFETLETNYKQLECDRDSLKHNLEDLKDNYNACFSEKEDLNVTVDQMKSECENTEYKYAEQNISLETLKEEVETHVTAINAMTIKMKKLEEMNTDFEGKNELLLKEVEDLKQELTAELENSEEKDKDLRELLEKLQASSSIENELKLQVDKLNRDYLLVSELKNAAESHIQNAKKELINHQNQMKEMMKDMEYLQESNKFLEEENNAFKAELETIKQSLNTKDADKIIIQELMTSKNALTENITALQNTLKTKENALADLDDFRSKYDLLLQEKQELTTKLNSHINQLAESTSIHEYNQLVLEKQQLQSDFENFKASVAENNITDDPQKISALENQVAELDASRNELIELIKQKHEENVNYHSEIQKLHQALSGETEKSKIFEAQMQDLNATSVSVEELNRKDDAIEKLTDQNNFLKEKCAVLAENLLQEQSNVQKVLADRTEGSEREIVLQKKLDKLRQHLLEVEEGYTKEVQLAEQKYEEMRRKLYEVEEREKNSSTRYTSSNIRANQQVETLQTQLQLITNQRDELKRKFSEQEDEIGKQKAALTNLHVVLQQFQRDKDRDIQFETDRMNRNIQLERQIQEALKKEIFELKSQLDDSKQGLKAAVRLSDQVDASKKQVTSMKEEVTKMQNQLQKSEEKYRQQISQTDGKVDKMLIKNLIIGMISSGNNNFTKDQNQILKIISTVLDFNQQDINKVKLNKTQQNSWFGSLLQPHTFAGQNMSQESLSLAFIKFLEAESKPRELPNLLEASSSASSDTKTERRDSSAGSSVRQSPLLLNEIVMPTFADFGQNRNSSSILKDVLKDSTNV